MVGALVLAGCGRNEVALDGVYSCDGQRPELPGELVSSYRTGGVEVVALGESFHFSGTFQSAKSSITRQLIVHAGARQLFFESPWVAAEQLNDQLQSGCDESLVRLLPFSLSSIWSSYEVAELMAWICQFNQDHPLDPVEVIGFDAQQPWDDVPRLLALYESIREGSGDEVSAGLWKCDGANGFEASRIHSWLLLDSQDWDDYESCATAVDNVESMIERVAVHPESTIRETDLVRARLHILGIRSWQEQVYLMHPGLREEALFDIFEALHELDLRSDTISVVWGHNGHILTNTSGGGQGTFGAAMRARYGDGYVSIGLAASEVDVDFRQGPVTTFQAVGGSFEHYADSMSLGECLYFDMDLSNATYFDDDVASIGMNELSTTDSFDGVLWMRRSAAMSPIYPF